MGYPPAAYILDPDNAPGNTVACHVRLLDDPQGGEIRLVATQVSLVRSSFGAEIQFSSTNRVVKVGATRAGHTIGTVRATISVRGYQEGTALEGFDFIGGEHVLEWKDAESGPKYFDLVLPNDDHSGLLKSAVVTIVRVSESAAVSGWRSNLPAFQLSNSAKLLIQKSSPPPDAKLIIARVQIPSYPPYLPPALPGLAILSGTKSGDVYRMEDRRKRGGIALDNPWNKRDGELFLRLSPCPIGCGMGVVCLCLQSR